MDIHINIYIEHIIDIFAMIRMSPSLGHNIISIVTLHMFSIIMKVSTC